MYVRFRTNNNSTTRQIIRSYIKYFIVCHDAFATLAIYTLLYYFITCDNFRRNQYNNNRSTVKTSINILWSIKNVHIKITITTRMWYTRWRLCMPFTITQTMNWLIMMISDRSSFVVVILNLMITVVHYRILLFKYYIFITAHEIIDLNF